MSSEAVLALSYAGFLLILAEGVRRFVQRKAAREMSYLALARVDASNPGPEGAGWDGDGTPLLPDVISGRVSPTGELPWPHWEALQLRQAVVAVMPSVAAGILLIVLVRHHGPWEIAALGSLLTVSMVFTVRALRSVRVAYLQRQPPA